MLRLRNRKARREREARALGEALVGMVDSAMIIACADGELTSDEVGVVASVIDGFFDGQASRDEIIEMIDLSLEAIERDGLDARMDAVAQLLRDPELRALALGAAAALALADETGDEAEEDATYYDLADALDISRSDADAIWDDVAAQYD